MYVVNEPSKVGQRVFGSVILQSKGTLSSPPTPPPPLPVKVARRQQQSWATCLRQRHLTVGKSVKHVYCQRAQTWKKPRPPRGVDPKNNWRTTFRSLKMDLEQTADTSDLLRSFQPCISTSLPLRPPWQRSPGAAGHRKALGRRWAICLGGCKCHV